jgi:prepilin-type N-terminal cleavage/methylation domain-containing protein
MRPAHQSGFTLIELLVTVALIGAIAAVATPALLRAKMSGNEASAIASLRAIDSGQRAFAVSCSDGSFADSLASLSAPPAAGGRAFISEDLSLDPSDKSGYFITVLGGNPTNPAIICSAATTADSYAAFGDPQVPGSTGNRYFFTNGGTIWEDQAPFPAVFTGPPGQGNPIQ